MKSINKLLIPISILVLVRDFTKRKNKGNLYDEQMIKNYKLTHSTVGMSDNEILKKTIELTGRQ